MSTVYGKGLHSLHRCFEARVGGHANARWMAYASSDKSFMLLMREVEETGTILWGETLSSKQTIKV
jgi:hypothetical protein